MSASHEVKINETPSEPLRAEKEIFSSFSFNVRFSIMRSAKVCENSNSHDYINNISYNISEKYICKKKFNVISFNIYF